MLTQGFSQNRVVFADIPGYVEDGVADLGIIGQNVLLESNRKVDEIKPL